MPYSVRCKACSASFAIPDEIWDKRVRGRVATLKCRSCKAEIHVDGTKEGVVQLSVAPPAAPTSSPAAAPAPAPASSSAAAAAPLARTTATSAAAPQATRSAADVAATPAKTAASPQPPAATSSSVPKPVAKSAQEVAAADSGWSLMPPPGQLEQVGLTPKVSGGIPGGISAGIAASSAEPTPAGSAPIPATMADSIPPLSVPPEAIEEAPAPDPNLWVVSYGEDDDRELTEKQIAAELIKGHVTLSTIVWQEGMDEWLPISGVKILAKYAPTQKPAPMRQVKPALATKAAQPARSAAAATATATTAKSGSAVPRLAAQPRERQPSSPLVDAKGRSKDKDSEPKAAPKGAASTATGAQPTGAEGKAGKGPPPLTRTSDRSDAQRPQVTKGAAATVGAGSRVPAPKAAVSGAGQPGGKPPPLGRRQAAEAASPWDQQDAAEDVVTSAPDVAVAVKAHDPALEPKAELASAPRSTPSQRAGAKTSFRPPKPVETATSTVVRTEGSPAKDLLITDEDFMAMQRRFPKWALPAAIAGGVVFIGLIVWASSGSDEPVRLPTTPTADANAALRENPANQAQPRHPQPNLDAIPTGAAVVTDEKDFAKLFAQSATKTNSTFDLRAAEHAATNVMELAARCRVVPEPAGQARAVLTFSTAGQVLSVQLGSPYANTATGKCVEKVLRQIRTKPFQGESGRLPLTVPIH